MWFRVASLLSARGEKFSAAFHIGWGKRGLNCYNVEDFSIKIGFGSLSAWSWQGLCNFSRCRNHIVLGEEGEFDFSDSVLGFGEEPVFEKWLSISCRMDSGGMQI